MVLDTAPHTAPRTRAERESCTTTYTQTPLNSRRSSRRVRSWPSWRRRRRVSNSKWCRPYGAASRGEATGHAGTLRTGRSRRSRRVGRRRAGGGRVADHGFESEPVAVANVISSGDARERRSRHRADPLGDDRGCSGRGALLDSIDPPAHATPTLVKAAVGPERRHRLGCRSQPLRSCVPRRAQRAIRGPEPARVPRAPSGDVRS